MMLIKIKSSRFIRDFVYVFVEIWCVQLRNVIRGVHSKADEPVKSFDKIREEISGDRYLVEQRLFVLVGIKTGSMIVQILLSCFFVVD